MPFPKKIKAKPLEKILVFFSRAEKGENFITNFQSSLTPTLSGFQNLNAVTLIIQNLLVSWLFANICHHLNFAKENKWNSSKFVITILAEIKFRPSQKIKVKPLEKILIFFSSRRKFHNELSKFRNFVTGKKSFTITF